MHQETYRGWIAVGKANDDYDKAVGLEPFNVAQLDKSLLRPNHNNWYKYNLINDPLAVEIEHAMHRYGSYLDVRYFIADEAHPVDVLQEAFLHRVFGATTANFYSHYSDYTGYLWTDEDLVVGGHDLLAELRSYVGKFCHLEITFHKEAS